MRKEGATTADVEIQEQCYNRECMSSGRTRSRSKTRSSSAGPTSRSPPSTEFSGARPAKLPPTRASAESRGARRGSYDGVTGSWRAEPDLLRRRTAFVAAATSGRLYVAGGFGGEDFVSEVAEPHAACTSAAAAAAAREL